MLRNHSRTAALAATIAALLALAGAASASSTRSTAGLTVYAAASLTDVFPAIDSSPSYSFAGSNALAQLMDRRAPPQLFARFDFDVQVVRVELFRLGLEAHQVQPAREVLFRPHTLIYRRVRRNFDRGTNLFFS